MTSAQIENENKVIEWRKGVPTYGITAETAHEALESIRAKNGGDLTDVSVLEEAKSKDHVLHRFFDWDDSSAAQRYRLAQASNLIRSVKVTYVDRPDRPSVTVYSLETAGHRSEELDLNDRTVYRTTEELMSDPESREILISRALSQMQAYCAKYRSLSELSELFEVLDDLMEKFGQ